MKNIYFACFLALMTLSGVAARADYHHDRRWEEEERRRAEERRHWAMEHREYHEIIAPAPVVYTAPPPSPGLSIVLPINIH